MRFTLACDESGAKGHSDRDEREPGEIGLFAGVLVPEALRARAEAALGEAVAPHRQGDGKFHIADLAPPAQAALRAGVYGAVRGLRLPCFWYAIHVAGFRAHHARVAALLAGAEAGSPPGPVRFGSPRDHAEPLHVELFRGLYGNVVAFIEERSPGLVGMEVRTDRVDAPVARGFLREAERLLDDGPRESVHTGFHSVERRLVSTRVTSTVSWPEGMFPTTRVDPLDLVVAPEGDPLVVAADVLANGLLHHFRRRTGAELYGELNRPAAVRGHPLAANLDTFLNWGGPDLVGDRMFRHPKAPVPRDRLEGHGGV